MSNYSEHGTTRVETSFRDDDYQILARVAAARHTSVAALIRRLVYEHIQPLQNAQLERENRAMAEARERKLMREWNERAGGVRSISVEERQDELGY